MEQIEMRILVAGAALASLSLLTACQTSIPRQAYFQEHCVNRAFEAGFCDQPTNLRVFTPYGPIRDDSAI